jgi:hypothetical protein
VPIPLAEIGSQAESSFRSVQSIEATLSTDPITPIVEKRLPALTREIELRGEEMAKFLGESVPLELLHSMEIVLQRYREQLSGWNRDLTERSKVLEGQIDQLDDLSKIWKSTLQSPKLSRTAPEIPKWVQSLIDLVDRTLVCGYWLRIAVHRWAEEEASLRQAATVFDWPIATAITLSFLATGSIYSTAPFLLRAILWGVFLISIAFILRRLIDRSMLPVLYALIVLYFVDQLRLLASLQPVWGG